MGAEHDSNPEEQPGREREPTRQLDPLGIDAARDQGTHRETRNGIVKNGVPE